jgi:hypothetical protein
MSTPDHVPMPPPQPLADAGPSILTEKQDELRKEVLEHFIKADYQLPDEEKGDLTEEEKFWLVSIVRSVPYMLLTSSSLMSVYCGESAGNSVITRVLCPL